MSTRERRSLTAMETNLASAPSSGRFITFGWAASIRADARSGSVPVVLFKLVGTFKDASRVSMLYSENAALCVMMGDEQQSLTPLLI